jgi:hypothetical protein
MERREAMQVQEDLEKLKDMPGFRRVWDRLAKMKKEADTYYHTADPEHPARVASLQSEYQTLETVIALPGVMLEEAIHAAETAKH